MTYRAVPEEIYYFFEAARFLFLSTLTVASFKATQSDPQITSQHHTSQFSRHLVTMTLAETLLLPVRAVQALFALIVLGLLADGEYKNHMRQPSATTLRNALTCCSHHELVFRI
jgi:hypothetical protein